MQSGLKRVLVTARYVIDKTVGLRVSEEQEREGLDVSLHGERVE